MQTTENTESTESTEDTEKKFNEWSEDAFNDQILISLSSLCPL